MSTDELIRALAADIDNRVPQPRTLIKALAAATAASSLLVGLVIVMFLSPSPHLAAGLHLGSSTMFIVVSSAMLAIAAFCASATALHPEGEVRPLRLVRWPALLMAVGIVAEMVAFSPSTWMARLIGLNPLACFALVSVLTFPILLAVLLVLRSGAPCNPRAAGAVAGLLAGAVTMGLYVLHCPEDSLLFVAAWHVPALLLASGIGAMCGARLLRW